MKIPTIHPSIKVANPDGTVHEDFMRMLVQLLAPLQSNLSDEGYTLPSLTSPQVTQLNTSQSVGRIIFNSTTGKAMINNNGTYQTINVT